MLAPPPHDGASFVRAFAVLALVGLLAASACTDSAIQTLTPSPSKRGWTHADSLQRGYFLRASRSASPIGAYGGATRDAVSDGTIAIVSVDPSDFQGFDQPDPVVVEVTGPVRRVSVSGRGAIFCSGNYGVLIAYDAAHTELGRVPLALIKPEDCSPEHNPDNVTFGAAATLTVTTGIIASFEITPMSPLEFQVLDVGLGHASADYTFTIDDGTTVPILQVSCDPAAPTRVTRVTCTATMSDTSLFTVTHLKSSSGGTAIVDSDVADAAPLASFEWAGTAVVATDIEITGAVGERIVKGTASFAIESRIGKTAQWMDPEYPDFPETPPAASFVRGAPLTGNYPGITMSGDGYSIARGAVGHTFFRYPMELETRRVGGVGPNKGVKFVGALTWVPEDGEGGPTGIFMRQSLQSTDRFYRLQAGPPPMCDQNDMAALKALILRHERLHWTEARRRTQPLRTQTVIEGLVELPGAPPLNTAYLAARDAFAAMVRAANDDVEDVLLPVQSNAPVCNMRPLR